MKVEQVMRSEARHVSPVTDLATAGRTMAEVGRTLAAICEHPTLVLAH